ncbi:hypothetical protein Fcan01_00209 [Folsomia candida]|uniref:Uncharacterized protein n=1 Tax=Folsomia candida TaxID=158441 RepID=A0A226F3A0_FOLCA|nr:hypothetical protein Fcan01_00209 [Folsomia candida]
MAFVCHISHIILILPLLFPFTVPTFPKLFNSCTLQFFLLTGEPRKPIQLSHIAPYFNQIRLSNPSTPLLINGIFYNQTDMYLLNTNFPFFATSPPKKRQGHLITFVNLEISPRKIVQFEYLATYQVKIALTKVKPNYIFAHLTNPAFSKKFYSSAFRYTRGIAKLVIFSHLALYIPCIACNTPPEKVHIYNLATVDDIFTSKNKNFWNKIIIDIDVIWWTGKFEGKCGPNLAHYEDMYPPKLCVISVLGKKMNFTLIPSREYEHSRLKYEDHVISYIAFHTILAEGFNDLMFFTFKLDFNNFRFAIVTELPSVLNNLYGIYLPFDNATWICLLVGMVVTGVLARREVERGKMTHAVEVALRLISFLLGQSGSSNVAGFSSSKRAGIAIATAWFFGVFILMGNLYQGSIFSYLTVKIPPIVPETVEELLESGITILTSSYSAFSLERSISLLRDVIIPVLTSHLGGNERWAKLLDRLAGKIEFMNYDIKYAPIPDAYSNFTAFLTRNKSKELNTFALMDRKNGLLITTKVLKIMGKQLIVENREETFFNSVGISYIAINYVSGFVIGGYNCLVQSGISSRWEKLQKLRETLYQVRKLGNVTYNRFFLKEMGGGRNPVEFHENQSVSLAAIGYFVMICGVLVGIGWVMFLGEIKIMITTWFTNLVEKFVNTKFYGRNSYRVQTLVCKLLSYRCKITFRRKTIVKCVY